MSGRILFISDDVMFWARVRAAADAASREIVRIDGEAAMEEAYRLGGVARVIADLGCRSVNVYAWAARWKAAPAAPELVAFGSHVDEASLLAAREAGFDTVMPNSRFHRTVGALIAG
jgi:DNA-binding response OmpR family regulator